MLAEQTPASFIAFDLLALGDDDYTQRPFSERRAALVDALAGAGPSFHVTPATTDPATAQRWFSEFEGAGLDGVVAKPLTIPYLPDKRIMFKVKHERTADCVVAGYRVHKSGADAIGSLMLGLYKDAGTPVSRGGSVAVPSAPPPPSVSSARSQWPAARNCSPSCNRSSRTSTTTRGTGPRTRRGNAPRAR